MYDSVYHDLSLTTPMLRTFLAAALAAALLGATPSVCAQQKASDIPVETFFKRQDLASMSLSPDGKTLAALTAVKGRTNIVVVSLETRKSQVITSFETFDVVDFFWVNNKRVFFRVADVRDVLGRARFEGTYAIDIDGQNLRNLSDGGKAIAQGRTRLANIVPLRRTNDGTDDMIVEMEQRFESIDAYRLDTRTGRTKEFLTSDAPADTDSFLLDWNLVPRVAWSSDRRTGITTLWYREGLKAPWVELMKYGVGGEQERIEPISFNADNETLFVASNVGRDKAAIYAYDPKTKKLGDVIFEHPMIDVWSGLIFDINTRKLLGVRFTADKPQVIWIDPEYRRIQAQVDASLPKTINQIIRPDDSSERLLVFAWSDTDPGRYYLLTRNPLKMEPLLPTRAEIKPELMSPTTFIQYKARDGLEIPAWLTIPKASSGKNLPLVVNIHGGPWLRIYGGNMWGRPEAQFLASRGYAVLEPEPRASDGFGRKHLTAGYRQFGQAMQDDITDGVLHLIKQGIVDKNRVCLYGASYGGYATLQGLVREPDMFRCGVSFVAVTDLVEWVTSNETDTNMATKMDSSVFFHKMVGDPSKDRAMMNANSPAQHAKRIKVPVLLAMGQIDVRVPLQHGRLMRSAMEEAGVKHEYLTYAGEGHGWNKDENNFDWYKRVEKFLAENLK
jgi:dipeptidyl aminopeptidase/acylaminoacyl peptidase